MKILVACEESQAVTIELRKLGHEAYSCDLEDCSGGHPEWHIKDDAIKTLYSQQWDLVIAHPPCTYLTNAGVRWLASETPRLGYEWSDKFGIYINHNRYHDMVSGAMFFNEFVAYGMAGNKIAIENPVMHKYAKELIKIDQHQVIQPYMFGHTEKKATCLWLFGIDPLMETNNVYEQMMALPYAERAKIHYASPGKDRAKIRSKTYDGIARAIAYQWTQPISA
jgi:hypothetical protein